MNLWNQLTSRLAALFRKRELDADMDDEIRSHIEMRTQANIEAGMNPEEARIAALRQFGWIESIKETCREQRGVTWLENPAQDIRFGARQMRKNPGFTAVAVLTLALGIGANTAIFSVVYGVLFRSLPYRDPSQLVTVCESLPKRDISQIVVAPGNLRDWQEQNSTFQELGGQVKTSLTLTGQDQPEHLHAAWTTPNYFSVFGVAPLLGRTYVASDEPPDYRVVVLSHGLWQRKFGADPEIVGQGITLSGRSYTVAGVMPPEFKIFSLPTVFGLPTGDVQPQLWAPYPGSMNERTSKYFLAFGRLKPGISPVQAQGELSSILHRAIDDFPSTKDVDANVQPLLDHIVGGSRSALLLLLGAVTFVLLIACANVANLSLVRSSNRAREFAIRSALGAPRRRLIGQLLVESMLQSIIAGALGAGLAWGTLVCLKSLRPANLPRLDEVQLDGWVLMFTLAVSVLTGLVFGLIPAFHASKTKPGAVLKEGERGVAGGPHRLWGRRMLLVSEVALAMMLLVGAGLLMNSFARLIRIDPGFRPEQLMTFDFSPAGPAYDEDSARMNLVKQLRTRVQAQPGVTSAATVYGLPFGTMLNSLIGVFIDGKIPLGSQERASAGWRVVSPNYFTTMGTTLLTGRTFSEQLDTSDSPPVAIINESFQRKYFQSESPLGQRIMPSGAGNTNWHEIVGVIKDTKMTGLEASSPPEIYQSDSQQTVWMFSLVVRSTLGIRQIQSLVRSEVAAVDKDLPFFNSRTMEQAIGTSVAPRRFLMLLTGLFAALALTLTAIGVYGVISYSVTAQTREIGIRVALGASRSRVSGVFLRQGLMIALLGITIGLIGSLVLTRLIAAQLFGVSPTDPVTLITVAMLLTMISVTACYFPSRRATRIDPMEALRHE